jgi:hypothetical protein
MASNILRLSPTLFSIAGKLVKIDESEAHRLVGKAWHINNSGYVNHCFLDVDKRIKAELLHRSIIGAKPGQIVDHIDGDKLNNQRSNLRLCTHSENVKNRKVSKHSKSGLKGVRKHKNKWSATITSDKVIYRLGQYDTPELAHAAYCEASKKLHGEFSRLN